jgi:hypothetical protein
MERESGELHEAQPRGGEGSREAGGAGWGGSLTPPRRSAGIVVERLLLFLVAVWAGAPALVGLLFPQTLVRMLPEPKPLAGSVAVVAVIELAATRLGLALVAAWSGSLRRPPRVPTLAVAVALLLGAAFVAVAVASGLVPKGDVGTYKAWLGVDGLLALGLLGARTFGGRRS